MQSTSSEINQKEEQKSYERRAKINLEKPTVRINSHFYIHIFLKKRCGCQWHNEKTLQYNYPATELLSSLMFSLF